jgi:2-oxo-4-hydroxy-4-carboxy-5-ureidoimidazoline decarboxylase
MADQAGSTTLAHLNAAGQPQFVAVLGGVFEHSPWVAERAWHARPFASVDHLHGAMMAVVTGAPRADQVRLLQAHPDLAGRAARAGGLTDASTAEQASAGLDRLTDEESARFARLNRAYREAFGFPFIIAVRRVGKADILAAFERRLTHSVDEEIAIALAQVADITRLRLARLVAP